MVVKITAVFIVCSRRPSPGAVRGRVKAQYIQDNKGISFYDGAKLWTNRLI